MTLTWQMAAIAASSVLPLAWLVPGGLLADHRLGKRLARLEKSTPRIATDPARPAARRTARGEGGWLEAHLEQAGWSVTGREWRLMVGIVSTTAGGLIGWISGSPLAGVLGAAILVMAACTWLVSRAARVRRAFLDGLPAALWTMAGSLKAGQGFLTAWQRATDEKVGPAGRPWRDVLEETTWGIPVEEALARVAREIRATEVDLMVEAIAIQRTWGGNLAEILTGLHDTLRERQRLAGEVKALTAQGRLSAWVLGGLPLCVGLALHVIDPGYLGPMWASETGRTILLCAVGLQGIGVIWMRRAIRVED